MDLIRAMLSAVSKCSLVYFYKDMIINFRELLLMMPFNKADDIQLKFNPVKAFFFKELKQCALCMQFSKAWHATRINFRIQ